MINKRKCPGHKWGSQYKAQGDGTLQCETCKGFIDIDTEGYDAFFKHIGTTWIGDINYTGPAEVFCLSCDYGLLPNVVTVESATKDMSCPQCRGMVMTRV